MKDTMNINITGNAHSDVGSMYMDVNLTEDQFRKIIADFIKAEDNWSGVDVNEITINRQIFHFENAKS